MWRRNKPLFLCRFASPKLLKYAQCKKTTVFCSKRSFSETSTPVLMTMHLLALNSILTPKTLSSVFLRWQASQHSCGQTQNIWLRTNLYSKLGERHWRIESCLQKSRMNPPRIHGVVLKIKRAWLMKMNWWRRLGLTPLLQRNSVVKMTESCQESPAKTVPAVRKRCWRVRRTFKSSRPVRLNRAVASAISATRSDVPAARSWASLHLNPVTKSNFRTPFRRPPLQLGIIIKVQAWSSREAK